MVTTRIARFAGLLAVLALALVGLSGPAALAQQDQDGDGGQSTPGVTVTAQNPGTSSLGSDIRLTLTAHTDKSSVPDPSCRPQDATLRCTASLVLRIPDAGGLSVAQFQVHRVAVGSTGCAGDDENCGGEMAATGADPVQATVHGVAVLTDPGNTGLTAGSTVQVFIDLVDNGTARYADQVRVRVRPFVTGPVKPGWAYDSDWQTIQQVQIHELGGI